MNKFTLYRIIAPFRSRLQSHLRDERMHIDADRFSQSFGTDNLPREIARALWTTLTEQAFVPDFRPEPDDSLSKVYAMGPEEVRDDVIDPILTDLGLNVCKINFKGFNFSSIETPRDIVAFILRVAELQNGEDKENFIDFSRSGKNR